MSSSPLSRTDAFAFLIPLTVDAREALELRANRGLLEDPKLYGDMAQVQSEGRYIAKLDFALLFGRLCLSFGSSRSDEVQFPPASDIDRHHFILHFQTHTAVLLLSDTSSKGIWVSDGLTQTRKLLHHTSFPLLQTVDIHFGQDCRYRFRIMVTESARNRMAFPKLFEDYIQSITQTTSVFTGRTSPSSTDSSQSSEKKYEMVLNNSIDRDSRSEGLQSKETHAEADTSGRELQSPWKSWAVKAFTLAVRWLSM
jgi:hypothetical protein